MTLTCLTPATTTQNEPQHTFLLREDKSLEHNLNRFWEVEPVEQWTMKTEQQFCEQHFITHTTQQKDGRFVVRLPTKLDPNDLDLLASLQSDVYMQLNVDWNEIQNSRISTTNS